MQHQHWFPRMFADMAVRAIPWFVFAFVVVVSGFLTVVYPFPVRPVVPWLVGQVVRQRLVQLPLDLVVRAVEQAIHTVFDTVAAATGGDQCFGIAGGRRPAVLVQEVLDLPPRVGEGDNFLIVRMLDGIAHDVAP